MLGVAGMVLLVAWLWPGAFRQLGWGRLSDWLEAGAHRVTMLVPIWLAMMASYGVQRRFSRAATPRPSGWFATVTHAAGVIGATTLEAGPRGPGVETRGTRRWLLTLDTVNDASTPRTRVRCAVAPRRDFHFALLPQSGALRVLTSPRVGGFLLSLGRSAYVAPSADQARRHALEEAAFMVGPPIELGEPEFDHAFLLKSDDAEAARSLFGHQRGWLLALRRPGSGWQLTLAASVQDGTGQLEFRESGLVRDAARLEAVQQAMIRVLEELAARGFIGEDRAASNP